MEFKEFKNAMAEQFAEMQKGGQMLFVTAVDKDKMWEKYLSSFPPGTNEIYKTRREFDCQCCKQFIRACGNLVSIENGELSSLWDLKVEGFYQVVADKMAEFVKSAEIKDSFLYYQRTVGTDKNIQMLPEGNTHTWNHFSIVLPDWCVRPKGSIDTLLGERRSGKDVFLRGLTEITQDSIETVLELISQNSLYRGEEHKGSLEAFLKHKKAFNKAPKNYAWMNLSSSSARFRNTAIGTLVVDISCGAPLDQAVRMFESKVAPANYKRPTAIVTKAMIENAQKAVQELGIEIALSRRFAVESDLTINNILFADRAAKAALGVFDEMISDAPVSMKSLEKVEEVDVETFITGILPKASSISLLLENQHLGNLVSLISPCDPWAKGIFKWDNNFSWSYKGEFADSIKERVKAAGGSVTGDLRLSIGWFNYDDLDNHLVEPGGRHIFFGNKFSYSTLGQLDVDMNAGGGKSRSAVENITYPDKRKMREGEYRWFIHQYNKRESSDIGFTAEMEFERKTYTFNYPKAVVGEVVVARFKYSHSNGVEIIESLPSTETSKTEWGLASQKFHEVSMIMNSPNHWDGNKTGNKHYFFMLKGCKNEDSARGFYNEFLNEGLTEHRKVFEILGSKMKVPQNDNQLSGLGFSSTQRNSVFCKVSGSFTRTIKIIF